MGTKQRILLPARPIGLLSSRAKNGAVSLTYVLWLRSKGEHRLSSATATCQECDRYIYHVSDLPMTWRAETCSVLLSRSSASFSTWRRSEPPSRIDCRRPRVGRKPTERHPPPHPRHRDRGDSRSPCAPALRRLLADFSASHARRLAAAAAAKTEQRCAHSMRLRLRNSIRCNEKIRR